VIFQVSKKRRSTKAEIGASIRSRIAAIANPKRDWCPHKPYPKQQAFLDLTCDRAFFGGAAGGGKSDVLLMAALQYAHVPGYAALIIRRNYTALVKSGAIMDRAKSWLRNSGAKWNGSEKRFTFPSGAILEFGHVETPLDWMKFQGTEYHFIGFDELTELTLRDDDPNNPYLCLNRSLRNPPQGVPLRMRAASNPGNIGHDYVKHAIIGEAAAELIRSGSNDLIEGVAGHVVLPSRIDDCPAVDPAAYKRKLELLPPITRSRLLEGDWDAKEGTLIDPAWFREWIVQDNTYVLRSPSATIHAPAHELVVFATVDTAGTSRERAEVSRGKQASFSVCAIWGQHVSRDGSARLLLLDLWRAQVDWLTLRAKVSQMLSRPGLSRALVENAHVGQSLIQELQKSGIRAEPIGPVLPGMSEGWQGAKLDRAIAAGLFPSLESGLIFVPPKPLAPWLPSYLSEHANWTGDPSEVCDQIDVTSYAVFHAIKRQGGGAITIPGPSNFLKRK
jgi:hypothetical protein